jgi:hypothetical protein
MDLLEFDTTIKNLTTQPDKNVEKNEYFLSENRES